MGKGLLKTILLYKRHDHITEAYERHTGIVAQSSGCLALPGAYIRLG